MLRVTIRPSAWRFARTRPSIAMYGEILQRCGYFLVSHGAVPYLPIDFSSYASSVSGVCRLFLRFASSPSWGMSITSIFRGRHPRVAIRLPLHVLSPLDVSVFPFALLVCLSVHDGLISSPRVWSCYLYACGRVVDVFLGHFLVFRVLLLFGALSLPLCLPCLRCSVF